jgi:hypothetical protein
MRLKTQSWRPDTHPGVELHHTWVALDVVDDATGKTTLVDDPDTAHVAFAIVENGICVHDGGEHAQRLLQNGTLRSGTKMPTDHIAARFNVIRAEHTRKNLAEAHVEQSLPAEFRKPELDSDGEQTGRFVIKDKHLPIWKHLGGGEYEFEIPGLTAAHQHHAVLSKSLADKFGGKVRLKG